MSRDDGTIWKASNLGCMQLHVAQPNTPLTAIWESAPCSCIQPRLDAFVTVPSLRLIALPGADRPSTDNLE